MFLIQRDRLRCKVCGDCFCCIQHRRAHEISKHMKANPGPPEFKEVHTFTINPEKKTNARESTPVPSLNVVLKNRESRKRKAYVDFSVARVLNSPARRSILRPKYRRKQIQMTPTLAPVIEDDAEHESLTVNTTVGENTEAAPQQGILAETSTTIHNVETGVPTKLHEMQSPETGLTFTTSTPITSQNGGAPSDTMPSVSEIYNPTEAPQSKTPTIEFKEKGVLKYHLVKPNETPVSMIPNPTPHAKTDSTGVIRYSRKRKVSFYDDRSDSPCYITAYETVDTAETFFTAQSQESPASSIHTDTSVPQDLEKPEAKNTGIFTTITSMFKNAFHCAGGERSRNQNATYSILSSPSGRKRRKAILGDGSEDFAHNDIVGTYITSLRANPIKGRPAVNVQRQLKK